MKIVIGCDHGGYEKKAKLVEFLKAKGYEIIDVGCNSKESCNYAEFGIKAAEVVSQKKCDYGVLICTSGEGISIAANKVKNVMCGICYNKKTASLLRTHNNANMIAFGAKFTSLRAMKKRTLIFLTTNFEGGRHEKRVNTILNYKN